MPQQKFGLAVGYKVGVGVVNSKTNAIAIGRFGWGAGGQIATVVLGANPNIGAVPNIVPTQPIVAFGIGFKALVVVAVAHTQVNKT